jgi:hypothetical protein
MPPISTHIEKFCLATTYEVPYTPIIPVFQNISLGIQKSTLGKYLQSSNKRGSDGILLF